MSDVAICVDKLSKRYRIGKSIERSNGLKSLLLTAFSPFRYLASTLRKPTPDEIIWALKDISFEVKRGEVIGIIGPNGSGKTTLLKILSRITEPTGGRAIMHGRVGSLLEVGTGFHPELTGRENVYLSGAILGMKKEEIDRKFDEIVAFSEIEKFIYTPVKRYSSGMYVRLAFAVAAHLEPEILLIDEVLAVGDIGFQRKCLGKMSNVAKKGRTVVFVSHNMAAVSNLCSRTVLLKGGKIELAENTKSVIRAYTNSFESEKNIPLDIRKDRQGNGRLRFTSVFIQNSMGDNISIAISGQPMHLLIGYRILNLAKFQNIYLSANISNMLDQRLFTVGTIIFEEDAKQLSSEGFFICTIPKLLLSEGRHSIDLHAAVNRETADHIKHAAFFDVMSSDLLGKTKHGFFVMPHSWSWSSTLKLNKNQKFLPKL